MNIKKLSADLESRAGVGRVFQLILMLSMALNLLQAAGFWSMDKTVRTVVIPAELKKPVTIGGTELSQDYLEQMGEFFIHKFATISPASIEWQFDAILKAVDPSQAGILQITFKQIADKIKSENVSRVFFPTDMRINLQTNSVAITGNVETWVANQKIGNPEVKTFLIAFFNRNGNALIKELRETETQAPFAPPKPAGN